jgi:tRNA-2-methylthio-N6-dimethylallyladenosine synthase
MTPTFDRMTFCIHTFGCQMNKHDSERIAGMLEGLGASMVETIEEADIVVFMTCCVREAADVRLYGQVASLKNVPLRAGTPLSKRIVAVGGCIGQRDGEKLTEQLPHLDVVFGTHNLGSLPGLLSAAVADGAHHVEVLESSADFPTTLPTAREHSWAAWLPITVGCDNFCSYCIVPYVRGREKSRTLEDIAEEARGYVGAGVREITLLGQNVNSYGRDLYGEPRFVDVLDAVDATGIERLRFATSHPKDLTDEVIARFGTLRSLMPALHLPAQSGSDRILAAMNRRYTREHYLGLIAKLREACPGIALSTDIIVGFPGETEEDFLQTLSLVEEVGYSQVFTFIYSKREGTPAAKLVDDTPREVIQERFDRLVEAVQRCAYEANQAELGKVVDVLVEGTSKRDGTMLAGKSPKNQTVHAPLPEGRSVDELVGAVVPVRVDEARTWYLAGTVADGGVARP